MRMCNYVGPDNREVSTYSEWKLRIIVDNDDGKGLDDEQQICMKCVVEGWRGKVENPMYQDSRARRYSF